MGGMRCRSYWTAGMDSHTIWKTDTMKKIYKVLIMVGVVIVLGGLIAWVMLGGKDEPKQTEENIMIDIPEGDSEGLQSSKSEAYQKAAGVGKNYDDYFDSLLTDNEDSATGIDSQEDKVSSILGLDTTPAETSAPAPKSKPGGGSSGTRTTAKSAPASDASTMTSDEKFIQDMERARMIAAAMGMGEESPAPVEEDRHDRLPDAYETPVRHTGIISSLDEWDEDFDGSLTDESMPVKCMFMRDEKVKNGQRVTFRTLQDFVAGGHLIPANSHLSATCSINERLMLTISSVELGGVIIPLDYQAFDFDGSKGIYCPETGANKNSRSATNQAVSQGSSMIGGRMGAIASAVVRTGASIFQSATGESYVNLTNGYEFYIMKARK